MTLRMPTLFSTAIRRQVFYKRRVPKMSELNLSLCRSLTIWQVGGVGSLSATAIWLMRWRGLKAINDYGIFAPIQVAAIMALRTDTDIVAANAETYRIRRDVLVEGLNRIGWKVQKPHATMFVWAPIPEPHRI